MRFWGGTHALFHHPCFMEQNTHITQDCNSKLSSKGMHIIEIRDPFSSLL